MCVWSVCALCDTLPRPAPCIFKSTTFNPLSLILPLSFLTAISNPEAAQYEIIPLSNGKGSSDGVYDVPCEVDKMEHTSGPHGYEVPRSSTLHSSSEAVACASVVENGARQGEIHYNMGCRDDETLCNPTATPTYGNKTEHKYQEADFTSKSTHPVLKVSALTIGHPCETQVTQPTCNAVHTPCATGFVRVVRLLS